MAKSTVPTSPAAELGSYSASEPASQAVPGSNPWRVLVTGGAGFIGSHLVDALVARGIPVAALDNLATGRRSNLPPDVPLYEVDIGERPAVLEAVHDFRPTHIVHQAAQASVKVSVDEPGLDAQVNIMGGIHLLDAARASGVQRIVFASTGGAIYGEVEEGDAAREDWPARPASPYAASKAAFEHYLEVYRHNYGLPYTVLRYANVFGPRQDPDGEAGVIAIFIGRLLAGQPVTVYARRDLRDEGGVRDYVWVGDVVAANMLVLEQNLDGFFNVGTGEGRTTRQVLGAIEQALGVEAEVEVAPPRPGDLERSVISPARLESKGWRRALSFSAGIERTVDWFRQR